MQTICLVNTSKTIMVLNLPHGIVPEHSKAGIVGRLGHVPKTGERPLEAVRKQISGSVTLLAGQEKEVAASATHAPDVIAAKRRGLVVKPGRTIEYGTPDAPAETPVVSTSPLAVEPTAAPAQDPPLEGRRPPRGSMKDKE